MSFSRLVVRVLEGSSVKRADVHVAPGPGPAGSAVFGGRRRFGEGRIGATLRHDVDM